MKISFENLGPLKLGEIELNKFTVFCGENNTGKTYINYLIYNILTQISIFNKKLKIDIKTLFDKGELIINLDNLLDENIEEILKELSQNVKQNMPRVFNTKEEFFTRYRVKYRRIEAKYKKN